MTAFDVGRLRPSFIGFSVAGESTVVEYGLLLGFGSGFLLSRGFLLGRFLGGCFLLGHVFFPPFYRLCSCFFSNRVNQDLR